MIETLTPAQQDSRTKDLVADRRTIWLDVRFKGEREWTALFTYGTVKAAAQMRDHWKGVKRVEDYPVGFSKPVVDARVREVNVSVTTTP